MADRMPWDITAADADGQIASASAPQAAMSGFHGPYTIPDTATAALGVPEGANDAPS